MSDTGEQGKGAGKVVKARKAAGGAIGVSDIRRKRQVALGAVLGPILEPALAKQGVMLAQILPHWRAICPLLAPHSLPEAVKGDVLTVAVSSDGVKQELHYITPQIVEGITRLLGYEGITKVRAVTRHDVGRMPATAATAPRMPATANSADRDKAVEICKGVGDEGLRMALGRLGAEILKTHGKNKGK